MFVSIHPSVPYLFAVEKVIPDIEREKKRALISVQNSERTMVIK
jgi:hypothetical protein